LLKVDNNSPSFGQVNLIRVSKKAFSNPADMQACEREFDIFLAKAKGDKLGSTKLGLYLNDIQQFLFPKSLKSLSSMEGLRIRTTTGLPEKDYYSFTIFTGEDTPKLINLLSRKNGRRNAKITASEYTFENYMEQFSDVRKYMSPADRALCFKKYMAEQMKRCVDLVSRQARETFAGTKIHEFRINRLEELKDLKDKFGF